MRLFGRKRQRDLEPSCVFVVRCVRDVPAMTDSVEPWQITVGPAEAGPTPPLTEPEAERRWREAASEVVLELGRSDKPVGPNIAVGMNLADAIAEAAEGVIADPVAQRLVLPGEWRAKEKLPGFDPSEHLTLHVVEDGEAFWVHTHGLLKFGRAELELFDVPRDRHDEAVTLLLGIAAYAIDGPALLPGHTVGALDARLRAYRGTRERDHWQDTPVLELRGDGVATGEALAIWTPI
jgi:hypothetical protein